jgi:hypothetical protein
MIHSVEQLILWSLKNDCNDYILSKFNEKQKEWFELKNNMKPINRELLILFRALLIFEFRLKYIFYKFFNKKHSFIYIVLYIYEL